MLIRQAILNSIAAGEVTCAFRRWARPSVKAGSTLKTPIGILRITSVAPVSLASITAQAAREAGYASRAALLDELAQRKRGRLYRIDLHLEGADPRIALREQANLSAAEVEGLRQRLARFDVSSRHGPWTVRVMQAIRTWPKEKAGELATRLGVPKEWLKINVRKLKNLGFTISHEPGYELSPRGERLLQGLADR